MRDQLRVGWRVVPPLIPAVFIVLVSLAGNPKLTILAYGVASLPLSAAVVLVSQQAAGSSPRFGPAIGAVVGAVMIVANWYMLAIIARAVWRIVRNIRAARDDDDPDA